jgi:hypothetical protein
VQFLGYRWGWTLDLRQPTSPKACECKCRGFGKSVAGPCAVEMEGARPSIRRLMSSINSRYVSISRASHEVTLFTDDVAKLEPQLGSEVSKAPALEINQSASIAQGIGMGLSQTPPTLPDTALGLRLAASSGVAKRAFSFSPRWSAISARRMKPRTRNRIPMPKRLSRRYTVSHRHLGGVCYQPAQAIR